MSNPNLMTVATASVEVSGAADTIDNKRSIHVKDIPLSLYIHIPWCVKKCPYCDFNSHELETEMPSSLYEYYVDALLTDAQSQQSLTQQRAITSIFIGGGTPSLLPIAQYQRLFAGLRNIFVFADDIEVTMEANPGTLEHAPFIEYLQVGINRLSVGVQSFAAEKLQALGRIHNPEQAISAIKAARAAGFTRVNVDLMHGLPQQTVQQAVTDIQMAHDAGATHISWYQLTIEPNTVFYRSQPILPDEDNLADIEQEGQALLEHLGYRNYEVSAWVSDKDRPCSHNVNYWQFGDYLAIGAGAHGKVSQSDGIYRFSKSRAPKDYLSYQDTTNQNAIKSKILPKSALYNQTDRTAAEQESASKTVTELLTPKMVGWKQIADDELISEFMLNVLRLHGGIDWSLFNSRTGLEYGIIASKVTHLINKGLLVDSADTLQPTLLGQRYLNQILKEFL